MPTRWDGRIQGSAFQIPLADESVQMCVTSPPYYGLRCFEIPDLVFGGNAACVHEWGSQERGRRKDVLPAEESTAGRLGTHDKQTGQNNGGRFCLQCKAWKGQLGLEPTVSLFVSHLVEAMREVRRVLRKDGVAFVNIADCYSHGTRRWRLPSKNPNANGGYGKHGYWTNQFIVNRVSDDSGSIKTKDLCLIPETLALALRDDGWYLRQRIIWTKKTPMPESISDRPTSTCEYIWLLSKSKRYYWDKIGAAELAVSDHASGNGFKRTHRLSYSNEDGSARGNEEQYEPQMLRNMRNFWLLGPENYTDGEHFATFPSEVPRRCIRAATSEKGACLDCGSPYVRMIAKLITEAPHGQSSKDYDRMKKRLRKALPDAKWRTQDIQASGRRMIDNVQSARDNGEEHDHPFPMPVTVGWKKTCRCQTDDIIPCLVLDCFAGTNTTGMVAEQLNRRWIGLDLGYQDMQGRRLKNVQKEITYV